MSERLSIKNFVVIKEADLEIRKINVLIGRQASGKSVIAKLTYFFREVSGKFIEQIQLGGSKRALDSSIIKDFESRFPSYAWDGSNFIIKYSIDDIEFVIRGEKTSKSKTKVKISYSEGLKNLFSNKKKLYAKKLEEARKENDVNHKVYRLEGRVFYENVVAPLREGDFARFFSSSTFIPASRSFFANLQKNIFTFLASNLDIDPFLKEFGSLYENSKRLYKDEFVYSNKKGLRSDLDLLVSSIVDGKYEFEEDQDWINRRGKRINLLNASSGQQEALPMLLTLSVWPFIAANRGDSIFFIEEPEAHLFPTAQSKIVSILTMLLDELDVGFYLTTHSPYILSALNNHILAWDVYQKGGIDLTDFEKLNHSGRPVPYEAVAAYNVSDGMAEPITDDELRIVGADVLDQVSEHFQSVMNELLEKGG